MPIRLGWLPLLFSMIWLNHAVFAAVLPEDRADALYHSYDGGGVEVTGPSILVRKQFGASTSMFANYYVDMVSSASIDVVTTASPYTEERTEQSIGIDYLHVKTNMSLSYTSSEESDYKASSIHFGLSQDIFGDLTTFTMGYSKGADTVDRNFDPSFIEQDVDRQNYRLGLTQILTKNLITGISWETITDEGFLRNPYRQIRYLVDENDPSQGDDTQEENYPNTRTSNALALRGRYFLPYRAALHAEYKYFQDSWGIEADTFEFGYTHPKNNWIFEARYRIYSQTPADFYSDLFPRQDPQNFFARDKELSTYESVTLGIGVSYEFTKGGGGFIEKGSLNLSWDYISFDYDDFLDRRESQALGSTVNPGEESPYSFSTNVIQFYISIWY